MILDCAVKIDYGAIARDLTLFPWFAVGRGPSDEGDPRLLLQHTCCWHAARVFHRYRMLHVPEASVERIGSILHHQFHTMQQLSPAQAVDRALLAQAMVSCLGQERDELLKACVAKAMKDMRKQKMVRKTTQVLQVSNRASALEDSGRLTTALAGHSEEDMVMLTSPLTMNDFAMGAQQIRVMLSGHRSGSIPSELPALLKTVLDDVTREGSLECCFNIIISMAITFVPCLVT